MIQFFLEPHIDKKFDYFWKKEDSGKELFVDVVPEIIDNQVVLNSLNLSRKQLIEVAILIGTDYNPGA